MRRRVKQRELRKAGRPDVRAVKQVFVRAEVAVAAFQHAPRVNGKSLRRDLDALVSQDSTPRCRV